MKVRFRKCKNCDAKYEVNPKYPLFPCCGFPCAIEYQALLRRNKAVKDWKVKKAEMKSDLMTHKDWIKLYQITFNTFIRLRDKGKNCISCDTPMGNRKGDASHYFATTYQFLRFNEDNVHLSCVHCNQYKSGNFAEYTPRLEIKIGIERVQWLHAHRHDRLEISIPEIQEKIKEYKQRIKDLSKK